MVGRTYMKPADCPFRAADRILDRIGDDARVIIVDVHAEATSDKQLLGRYLDGRVSAVLGTHTHVVTADEQILKNGTAYQTDVGMTGPHDSILGRRYDRVLSATLTCVPAYFDVATGDPRLNGALVTIDPQTGRALVDQPRQHQPGRGAAAPDRFARAAARAVRLARGRPLASVGTRHGFELRASRSSCESPRAKPRETACDTSNRRCSR